MANKALFCESLIVLDIELFVKFLVGLKVVGHLLAVLQRCITPAITFVEPVLSHDADEVNLKTDESASEDNCCTDKVGRAMYYVAKGALLNTLFLTKLSLVDIQLEVENESYLCNVHQYQLEYHRNVEASP